MIKFIAVVTVTLWMSSTAISEKNYEKITAEWSSYVFKQRHHFINPVDEQKSKRENHFRILEQWKVGIKKININRTCQQ